MNEVRRNSFKAWRIAARPTTLTGAVIPVIVGITMLYKTGSFSSISIPAFIFCLLFAILMQIDANFINDYFDWKKGADTSERLGPPRACAQEWIAPNRMLQGIIITSAAAALAGIPLIYFGGWTMVPVGLVCLLFAFLYTTTLSYRGWGDLLVIIFFGFVPVFFTYYVCGGRELLFTSSNTFSKIPALLAVFAAGLATGLVTDNLLIVNNYRDRDSDKACGKKTLVVLFGAKAAQWLYLSNGIIATILVYLIIYLCGTGSRQLSFLIPVLYLPFHIIANIQMVKINRGAELNKILGKSALNIFIFGICLTLTIFVTTF